MAGKLKPPSKEVTSILERGGGRGSTLPVLASFFLTLPRVSDIPGTNLEPGRHSCDPCRNVFSILHTFMG